MRVIRNEVTQQAERYRERTKKYYDDKKAVDKSYSARVGGRVFVKMQPRERSHAKHLKIAFKCDGQISPSVNERPGSPLSSRRCSQKIIVSHLIPSVPPPAAGERIQCVLDAARVLAVWKGAKTTLFYYRSFREVRRSNNMLFAGGVRTVMWVMPPKEPEDAFSWIQFTATVDLWLSYGAHVWMVNGPRSCDDVAGIV
ncbi:unnamed protein product [Haemonchus placei]|uniref:Core-2/I-branching beta-1,6-N-acetylglucosaminyltransferase family protein n=1 Tax=Haemonchus placei TaxID=6290 RepID=A0A0N4X5K4_HAEPC|nr:unnamed protein product [Haemonchus placei]